jgi:hypothetical protein
MRDFLKNKVVTALIVIATVILAGVAIFTAYRLYQSGTESVAPTAPESVPAAGGQPTPTPQACQELAFTITTPTPSVTVTPTVTPTATVTPTDGPTPTPTEPPRGSPSPTPTSTPTPTQPETTGTPTPTSVVTSTPMPTQTDQLPDAGISIPTILAGALGFLLIFLSLVLAL